MSTKTMRPPSRRVPLSNSSGSKRKERDQASPRPKSSPTITKLPSDKSPNPVPTNMLLAGYLAHEFLTKGTLLGRKMGQAPSPRKESQQQKYDRYVELSLLLKTNGAHLGEIVNPTQLAHFLKL
ncbi:hypothetical protein AAZX31_03G146900 [Glycine max]|uniref:Uncharacterized protein n=3 Tax=Glycine subgen. Soja TaxID=1462606 RepID=I1JP57_SOYBN|nr:hypothetical protein GYH30_007440 [Glycine max]KAH1258433.1 hypothetical protein GmHk_03G008167 [Glycine max]KHN10762.1 hypothetical protein glysoja_019193 [Glycine soja]KRH67424.1 hypothetical protein GLYMA_03G165300v4 [Glycine max]RZC21011.1 hypothetical protein D0Y65_007364 [Glycine soja]